MKACAVKFEASRFHHSSFVQFGLAVQRGDGATRTRTPYFRLGTLAGCWFSRSPTSPLCDCILAEGERFELSRPLRPRRFSRPMPYPFQPALRNRSFKERARLELAHHFQVRQFSRLLAYRLAYLSKVKKDSGRSGRNRTLIGRSGICGSAS